MKTRQNNIERTHNPFNLRANARQTWPGQTGVDNGLVVFSHEQYAIRAMMVTLLRYVLKYQITTVAGLIGRWAPRDSNNTQAYIGFVSRFAGISPADNIVCSDLPMHHLRHTSELDMKLFLVMMAMSMVETGARFTLSDFMNVRENLF